MLSELKQKPQCQWIHTPPPLSFHMLSVVVRSISDKRSSQRGQTKSSRKLSETPKIEEC